MNKLKIIHYYDTIINDDIFGKVDLKGYKTDCYKFCPYLRKRGNNLKDLNNYKQDFETYKLKWLKDNNYLLFLEAFELIEPKYEFYYENNDDIKNKYNKLDMFFNSIYEENKRTGSGYFSTYQYYIKLMKAIINNDLCNIQALYIFNFMFKKIIEDIRENRLNDDILINNYNKYLLYWDNMPWLFMF
jgi:hypothetical protein